MHSPERAVIIRPVVFGGTGDFAGRYPLSGPAALHAAGADDDFELGSRGPGDLAWGG